MPENVARLATAIAIKDHYRRPGRGKLDKPPKYDADMLEFMEGARIVGVIFPEKWGGKYCLGRHDGEFGAFPAKAIELREPQETEIPIGGENGMSATAKWKWQPPATAGSPWLSFGKGEVITNVQCEYLLSTAWEAGFADNAQASTQTTGVGQAPTVKGKLVYFPNHISTYKPSAGRHPSQRRSRAGGGVSLDLAPKGNPLQKLMLGIEIPLRLRIDTQSQPGQFHEETRIFM